MFYLNRKIAGGDNELERKQFIELLKGLLKVDPSERWTASQAILHPFVQNLKETQEFIPSPSNSYSEIQKQRSAPSGALGGSCPSLLQRIRGSQDLTVSPKDVCFRPLVEELKDEFFTGFAHGKLVQVQQPPPQPVEKTEWSNHYMDMPIYIQPNVHIKSQAIRPQPNIIGPRYNRPHTYGAGEQHSHLERPISPTIEQNKIMFNKNIKKKKPWEKSSKKGRSNSSKYNDYIPKVINIDPNRPNSQDEKKIIPTGDKLFNLHFSNTIQADLITHKNISAKAVDPSGFLNKVKKEASRGNN